jgi:hypothetical protein
MALTNEQFLLTKLAEECNEVGQRALKQMQFGRDEVQPGQPLSNAERLVGEISDLLATVQFLFEIKAIPAVPRNTEAKRAKIAKYRRLSVELGMVEPEDLTQ